MYLCSSSASTELDDHDLWNSESAQTDSADSTRQLPNIKSAISYTPRYLDCMKHLLIHVAPF